MDLLLEFILELILEGSIEISSNKKVPKWLRYPIIFILIILFTIIIIGIFILGLLIYKDSIILSIALIILSISLLIGNIIKFRKIYLEKTN